MDWHELAALAGRNVHVVGLASTEGASMVRFLWASGVRRLTVHDFQSGEQVRRTFERMHVGLSLAERKQLWQELAELPIRRCFGSDYLDGIEDAEAVFVGQAWYLYPPNMPRLRELRDRGVPFHSLAELYFDLSPAPILAVTGSHGKSTTSRLVEAIMRRTNRPVYYAGNERRGVQVLDRLGDMPPEALLILEISNRQLVDITPRPHIGVVTTILPNHLDEHGGSFEAYVAVKRRLVAGQAPSDFAVLNFDDSVCRRLADDLPGRVYWFSLAGPVERGAWVEAGGPRLSHGGGQPVLQLGAVANPRLSGAHNRANILAASLACWLAGAPPAAIADGVAGFRGLRHRIQFVWRSRGVDYYDDLSATTPAATGVALQVLRPPLILIAGGEDKGLDYTNLARLVVERVRRVVLLPGRGSDRLAAAVHQVGGKAAPPIDRCARLAEAVARVVAQARPGDTVLLSPACPFFFSRHYQDGHQEVGFRALLRQLAREERAALQQEGDTDSHG